MYLKSAKIYSNFKFSNFNKSDVPGTPFSSLIGGRPKKDSPILYKNNGQQIQHRKLFAADHFKYTEKMMWKTQYWQWHRIYIFLSQILIPLENLP